MSKRDFDGFRDAFKIHPQNAKHFIFKIILEGFSVEWIFGQFAQIAWN